MTALRHLIAHHSRLALLALAAAFALKALLPAGFMLAAGAGQGLTVAICSGLTGNVDGHSITIPVRHGGDGEHPDHAKPDGQCAFSALAKAASGGADATLLLAALAFALLLAFGQQPSFSIRPNLRLLPPLRGPPASA